MVNKTDIADLLGVQKELQQRLGIDAPSYSTLRRMVATDQLKLAERSIDGESKRVMYSVNAVELAFMRTPKGRRIAAALKHESAGAGRKVAQEGDAGQSQVATELNQKLDVALDSIAQLLRICGEQNEQINKLTLAVGRLDSIRSTLMLKYDSDSSLKSQLIDKLREEVKSGNSIGDVVTEMTKTQLGIGRLRESIDRLAAQGR